MLNTQETCTDKPQIHGRKAEVFVADKLRNLGFLVHKMPARSKFDLLVGSKQVEVKAARFGADNSWRINLHRHGTLDESSVDAYVIVLSDIPGSGPMSLFLVIPAPCETPTLNISVPTLIRKYAKYVDNWDCLKES